MRKLFTLASLFVAMAMASCMYDDTAVVNSISDLQQRVSTLEKLQSANDRGLLIESVTETAEGYIVKFTDGSEITLYHGTDGKDGVDGVDGTDGKDGKDGANGDGACLLEDVVVTDKYVTFYLLDGNSFTFYFSTYKEAVGIVFDIEDGVACLAGASLEFGYTITGGYSDAAVECFGDGGWRARVINRSATAGTIKVTAPETGGDGKVVVLVLSPAGGTCMKSILFDEGAIENIVDRYETEWEACSLEVEFRTNLDYDVRIPVDAQSWISVAETRATMRDAAIVLAIDENEEGDPVRSAVVELVNDADDVLYSFEVCQKAQPTSEPIEFADKYAKLVCVQKYDKNGDGELSPKEAAEVTSIPSHFFGDYYQAVKSFDELKHFINLRTISDYAFSGCKSLKSVAIPKSVTSIYGDAFNNCSLENVYITDMSAWCGISFSYASSNPLYCGANLYLNNELVTELTIPNGITKIRSYAFHGCGSITSVTIPNGVTTVDGCAFYSCENLTKVTLPNGVTSIGSGAFYCCKSLATANLPDSITSIGSYAFDGCESLVSINIPQNLIKIDMETFYGCKSLKSVVIPDGVISIGEGAFNGCSSIESATIGADVVSIDSYAFANCSSLKSVNFTSATAPVLGSGVFAYCHIGCVFKVLESAYTNFITEPTWARYTRLLRYDGIERPAESYAFGDIVTVDGSVGIVFYASEDIVYIMSVEQASSTKWSTEHVDTYADDYTNGAYNTNVIKSIDGWEEKYPAFKWCADLGENWYLPANVELYGIYEAKDALNATLSANGYSTLGTADYWSSTERSSHVAFTLDFSSGDWIYGCSKNNTFNVRAVVAL